MSNDTKASVRDGFNAVRDAMLATFIEREDAVDCLMVGAIAQEHVVFLGPPGTAKSATIDALRACFVGARHFATLMTKFTTEDELCGPAMLSELKKDRFVRNVVGYLPDAEIAFLDETFKANSACLNATLTITNERKYKGVTCPLRMLVGASNEMPEDESLGAMYDRFLLRHVVEYVQSEAKWIDMLATPPAFVPPVQLSLQDWDAACAEARAVKVPRAVLDQLAALKKQLAEKGVIASDRRWIKLLGVLKAAAWLDGCAEVEVDHLAMLRFGLWTKAEDRELVATALKNLDRGPARICIDILDEAMRVYDARPNDPAAYHKAIPTIIERLMAAAKQVNGHVTKTALSKRARTKIESRMAELKATHAKLRSDLSKSYELGA